MSSPPAFRPLIVRAALAAAAATWCAVVCGCAGTPFEPGDPPASPGVPISPPTQVAGVQFEFLDPDPNLPSAPPATDPDESPAEPNVPADPPADAPALEAAAGVGLWPRTYTLEGMLEAFETASAAGDVGMIQVTLAWDALRGDAAHAGYHEKYDYLLQPIPPADSGLFARSGLRKAIWIDFLESADRRFLNLADYAGVAAFTNPDVAAAYVADCVWLADYWAPDFLALGTEIDEYLRVASAAERAALLAAFTTARDQIQSRHPGTRVFVYFQYENVVARDLWDLIRPFALESDLVAFSTYPSLPFPGPSLRAGELGGDYYAAIRRRLGASAPTAFVEVGHPAGPSALFADGSAAEQATFVRRLIAALPADTALVVWSHLFDPDYSAAYAPDVAGYFGSMGLLRRDSDAQVAAWSAWLELPETAAP